MALSVQEISDRIEINDLLIRYTKAIDQKDWKLLDSVFTPDAEVDYVSSGGIKGSYPEARAWLEKALAIFPTTVHYVTNSEVTLAGDRASARTAVYNPMFFRNPDGTLHHFAVGAYYVDELVRTAQGWRIAKRREDQAFLEGAFPKALRIPT
ncbi:MAG: nuclear transport factor 2 family protein [Myxococcota bacterium]